jgi:hypothetical protein
VSVNVKHLALHWAGANELFIIPKEVRLELLSSNRTPRMVTMIDDALVVAANERTNRRANILPVTSGAEDQLKRNTTEEFSPIVIGRETIAFLHPCKRGGLPCVSAADHSCTRADVGGTLFIIGAITHHVQGITE